jgi:hypothetical protein
LQQARHRMRRRARILDLGWATANRDAHRLRRHGVFRNAVERGHAPIDPRRRALPRARRIECRDAAPQPPDCAPSYSSLFHSTSRPGLCRRNPA